MCAFCFCFKRFDFFQNKFSTNNDNTCKKNDSSVNRIEKGLLDSTADNTRQKLPYTTKWPDHECKDYDHCYNSFFHCTSPPQIPGCQVPYTTPTRIEKERLYAARRRQRSVRGCILHFAILLCIYITFFFHGTQELLHPYKQDIANLPLGCCANFLPCDKKGVLSRTKIRAEAWDIMRQRSDVVFFLLTKRLQRLWKLPVKIRLKPILAEHPLLAKLQYIAVCVFNAHATSANCISQICRFDRLYL